MRLSGMLAALALIVFGGCSGQETTSPRQAAPPMGSASSPSPHPLDEGEGTLLVAFLGNSLTAGLGVSEEDSFPDLIETRLRSKGQPVRVLNAGVSGDTTAGGLSRLPWILGQNPDVLVVELGANDALRGQPLESIEANLRALIQEAREQGVSVLLLGMQAPPSYGPEYASGFADIYPRLAAELDVAWAPSFLKGVGGRPSLNLEDGIHPNAEGHRRLAENVLPHLEGLLDQRKTE